MAEHRSSSCAETGVTFGEEGRVGLQDLLARHVEAVPVEFLQPVAEHGAVDLGEDVATDLNGQPLGPDADDLVIERRVVQLAQRNAVGYGGSAALVGVVEDVRSVEQFGVT